VGYVPDLGFWEYPDTGAPEAVLRVACEASPRKRTPSLLRLTGLGVLVYAGLGASTYPKGAQPWAS